MEKGIVTAHEIASSNGRITDFCNEASVWFGDKDFSDLLKRRLMRFRSNCLLTDFSYSHDEGDVVEMSIKDYPRHVIKFKKYGSFLDFKVWVGGDQSKVSLSMTDETLGALGKKDKSKLVNALFDVLDRGWQTEMALRRLGEVPLIKGVIM